MGEVGLRETPGQGKQCRPVLRYGTHLPALLGEGSKKEQSPLPARLSGRTLPPALTPMPENSVPPCFITKKLGQERLGIAQLQKCNILRVLESWK